MASGPKAAGVVLIAADTGRALMLQRAHDPDDPAGGRWEWPGGHIEDTDSTSLHAGIREFEEEVGQRLPRGATVEHAWTNGIYQGHVLVTPSEADVDLTAKRRVVNPDDDNEQVAWWEVDHAQKNPALRRETRANPWNEIHRVSRAARRRGQAKDVYATMAPSTYVRGLGSTQRDPVVQRPQRPGPRRAGVPRRRRRRNSEKISAAFAYLDSKRDPVLAEQWEIFRTASEVKEPHGDSGIPGHLPAQLRAYWTHGRGLARWAEKPHPYTSLVNALRSETVPERMVHGLAANLFRDVFGLYPGQRPGIRGGNHGHLK